MKGNHKSLNHGWRGTMLKQLRIIALLTATVMMTGCGIMKTSNEMVVNDYKSTTHWSECALQGGVALGIPTALSSLATGGAAMVAGALVSGLHCAIADETPQVVLFDFNSYQLDMDDRLLLDTVAEKLGKNKNISLTGFTCSIGTAEVNQRLSENRAEAVKSYLIKKGIDESRISTQGKGKRNPVASNDKEETRKKNRRVEMKVLR